MFGGLRQDCSEFSSSLDYIKRLHLKKPQRAQFLGVRPYLTILESEITLLSIRVASSTPETVVPTFLLLVNLILSCHHSPLLDDSD